MKELYEWGHKSREEYLADYTAIHHKLPELTPTDVRPRALERLASLLKDIAAAWEQATQEQRNKLARYLFKEIWIKGKEVIAVRPQDELKPFFDLNHEAMEGRLSQSFGEWRPRGGIGLSCNIWMLGFTQCGHRLNWLWYGKASCHLRYGLRLMSSTKPKAYVSWLKNTVSHMRPFGEP